MSKFEVKVRRVSNVEPHPKADRLEFALIEGYRVVVKSGQVTPNDLVVYLPEAALLPEFVLRNVGLWDETTKKGLCAGDDGNRVKVVVLRGFISQGIAMPLAWLSDHPLGPGWFLQDADMGLWPVEEGDDVAYTLGITKHVPVVPVELAGAVIPVGRHLLPDFDIEDIKKYPGILQEGEQVFITEKLHGILTGAVLLPAVDAIDGEQFFVFGKGIGRDGLAFIDDEANCNNVYLKAAHKWQLKKKLSELASRLGVTEVPVFIIGETVGMGVQDLGYGMKPDYRVFAMGTGYRGRESYLSYLTALEHAEALGLKWVPELYRGPFSSKVLNKVISGKETLSGQSLHIREGGVIEPETPRTAPELGRVILKAISPDYLKRPGSTTEYQ